MKINPITAIIVLAISLLIAYSFYSFNSNALREVLSAGSFVLLFTTLFFSIPVRFADFRKSANVRIVSVVFFVTFLVSNLVFSYIDFTQGAYMVIHGIAFLSYILILYYIANPTKLR